MDPTRCPHCNKRMKPVVTDDGRTGLKCTTCDAVKLRQAELPRLTESPVPHAKVA
jgi:tRNA(Ile2) C34 agmatinyltransferase TiaS